ncbi:MAG: hypothetical protein HQL73_07820 [Magnetococcales bacterium]|nr:hypothetical protein [Magnetococcales bacterium]
MTTITMDFSAFSGLWQLSPPALNVSDETLYSDLVSALSDIRENLTNLSSKAVEFSTLCDELAGKAEQAFEMGVAVDFEQLADIVQNNEKNAQKISKQFMDSMNRISRQVAKTFPEMLPDCNEIRRGIGEAYDKQTADLRGLRFRLMALAAEAEDDGSGMVLESPEDVKRFFLSLA